VVYLLVGPQGARKSTWVKSRLPVEVRSVFFDAILVQRFEGAGVLSRLKPFGKRRSRSA